MNRQYYSINNLENTQTHPFGSKLEMSYEMESWITSLKSDDKIDVIKSDGTVLNWTRATIVNIFDYRIEVVYEGETSDKNRRSIKKTSFEIDRYKSRSLDFDWRENLEVGEFVDYYLTEDGWILCQIVAISKDQEYEDGPEIKTFDAERFNDTHSSMDYPKK